MCSWGFQWYWRILFWSLNTVMNRHHMTSLTGTRVSKHPMAPLIGILQERWITPSGSVVSMVSNVIAGLLFGYQEAARQSCSPPKLFKALAVGVCFPAGMLAAGHAGVWTALLLDHFFSSATLLVPRTCPTTLPQLDSILWLQFHLIFRNWTLLWDLLFSHHHKDQASISWFTFSFLRMTWAARIGTQWTQSLMYI